MILVENHSYIHSSDFYAFLEPLVKERIKELWEEIEKYNYIERDRGLTYGQRKNRFWAEKSLNINEDYMILFNPDYTKLQ